MPAAKFTPVPFRELPETWRQIDVCLADKQILDVSAIGTTSSASSTGLPSLSTFLNPTNNAGSASPPGVTPKLQSGSTAINTGAVPTAGGGRIFELCRGPACAAASTGTLENTYSINHVSVQWDLISGLTADTPGESITWILAKLTSSQSPILTSDTTKSAIGVNYAFKAADSTTPPGVANGQILGIDTATCAAAATGTTVAANRINFDLTSDLNTGVAAQALTRNENIMTLKPGERLVLIAVPVASSGNALSASSGNTIKAWGLCAQVLLTKYVR